MDVIYSIYNAQALVPSLIPHILWRGLRGYWPAWISQKEQGPWATEDGHGLWGGGVFESCVESQEAGASQSEVPV